MAAGTPTLETDRLALRLLEPRDAAELQRLAGDWEVARTLARVPHPYEDGLAEQWIASTKVDYEAARGYAFAIERREDRQFLGVVGLEDREGGKLVLGYWLGRPYWGRGYMTEAAGAVVAFGFEELALDRIVVTAMAGNLGSIGVIRKLGFTYRGRERQDFPERGEWREVSVFELTHAGYEAPADG